MTQEQTIVVGLDRSRPGRSALEWAMSRAEQLGSRVRVVRVIGTPPADEAQLLSSLREDIHDSQLTHPTVLVDSSLVVGEVVAELAVAAATAELLVIGTHKTGFVRGRVFGATGVRLANVCPVPLAVVPELWSRSRAGVAVGIDELSDDEGALDYAAATAERFGGELVIIHAWSPVSEWQFDSADAEAASQIAAEKSAHETLRDSVDRARSMHPHIPIRGRVVSRIPAEALVDASIQSAELVVGGPTRTVDRRDVPGLVVHEVLSNLVRPTIVVPAGWRAKASAVRRPLQGAAGRAR